MFIIDNYRLEQLGFVGAPNGLQVSVTGEVSELANFLIHSLHESEVVAGTVCKAYAKAVSRERLAQLNLLLQAHIAQEVEEVISNIC